MFFDFGIYNWWYEFWTGHAPRNVGIVDKIDLTFGGAGNQVMTIDGQEYATWISWEDWPDIGEEVQFEIYHEPDGRGRILRCARMVPFGPEYV